MTKTDKAISLTVSAMMGIAAPAIAAQVTISGTVSQPVRIICAKSPETVEIARDLCEFLKARQCPATLVVNGRLDLETQSAQLVLTTPDKLRAMAPGVSAPEFAANARDEAYLLDVKSGNPGAVIALVGKSVAGVRFASSRLISTVGNDGKTLKMAIRRELNDPFINIRALILGNAGRRQCPEGSPFKDIDFESWPVDKIEAYPALFKQFGFNCIQIAENRGYGSLRGEILKRTQNAVVALARGTKANNMLVSFDAWGDCPFNEGETYSWNDPEQHQVLVDYIEEMVRRYGPYVDHYNIHVGDPGGCSRDGCDPSYKTPQQIAAEYLRVFRKHNPKVMGALSTWANAGFWMHSPKPVSFANYREYFALTNPPHGVPIADGATFLDESFMPKEIGITQHQLYNDDQANMLVEAGRPVDVWSWYIGDMEMVNNLYIAMHRVEEAYRNMADSARDKIRVHTVEITFHGWPQIINQYCAAQLMWNPRRDLMEIEREFCAAAFGPQNAEAVLELYQVCENGVLNPIPQPADFATAEYNAKLRAVLGHAKSIRFSKSWVSNFAFPVPAQKFVDMLIARLRLTLAVSEAKEKVDAAKKSGQTAEQIVQIKKEALELLPKLPIDPIYDQSEAIIVAPFKTLTFAQMIEAL